MHGRSTRIRGNTASTEAHSLDICVCVCVSLCVSVCVSVCVSLCKCLIS